MCATIENRKRQQSYKNSPKQTILKIIKNKKFSKIFFILLIFSGLIFM